MTSTQQLLFANNAQGNLAGGIDNVATAITLESGQGALFPTLGAGQFFMGTLVDVATGLLREIVKVTGISGDLLTVVRGQEGTTTRAWLANDIFANLITAGSMAVMSQSGSLFSTNAGNPNGSVAGTQGSSTRFPDAVFDTQNNTLWLCTTTGNAAGAVWTSNFATLGPNTFTDNQTISPIGKNATLTVNAQNLKN